MRDLQLTSKTAFICGSTQGIGYSIAKQLLAEGVNVIINGRTQEKIDTAVNALVRDVPNAAVSGIVADFTKADEVARLLSALPAVDILVNNVGLYELKSFFDIQDDDWLTFFEVNVLSGVRLSRLILPPMLANNWGRIIFISSESAVNIPQNMIHYGMTKTAMLSISRGLSQLTKGTQVTVNTILGGPTYSEGVASAVEQLAKEQNLPVDQLKEYIMTTINPTSLLGRFIYTSELANLAVYLASPLSIATNGAALRADGGVLSAIL